MDPERNEEVAFALGECVRAMNEAQDRMLEVVRAHQRLSGADGGNPEAWVDTFLSSSTVQEVGQIIRYADVLRNTAHELWKSAIGTAAANEATRGAVDALGEALALGFTNAAMTCSCGDCEACKLKDARGAEVAHPEILRRMQARVNLPKAKEPKGRIIRPGQA